MRAISAKFVVASPTEFALLLDHEICQNRDFFLSKLK